MQIDSAVNKGHVPDLSAIGRSPPPGPRHEAPAPQTQDVSASRVKVETRTNPAADALAAKRADISRGGTRIHIDDATNQVITEILNESNEVIRQVPPEDAIRIAARFRQITGLLFDLHI